jgi:hypothetical protein
MGLQNYVIFTPDSIVEYSYNGYLPTKLHNVDFDSDYTFPIYFAQFTGTVVLKTVSNKLIYYKLGKPQIDSLYYEGV